MTTVATIDRAMLAGILALGLGTRVGARAAEVDRIPPSAAWVRISGPELRARHDTLWAVSDVHGRREELERVLTASGLAVRSGPSVAWNPDRRRQLLIVAGDLIDGGPDSVGVVLLFERLQAQAAAAGSRIVVLLGNHEAEFLANPRSATPELVASAARHAAELGLPRRPTPDMLDASAFGAFLRHLPVAAFVGTWLFAHAGYIDAGKDERAIGEYLTRLADVVGPRDRHAFEALLDPRSLVACHRWSRDDHLVSKMRHRLDAAGITGLVVGHDPDALGVRGVIAVNRGGWLLKLDTGLKTGRSPATLLRCDVARISSSDELVMIREGAPTCRAETPAGQRAVVVAR